MDDQGHPGWLGGIEVVATDLVESFRSGLSPHLDHARRVADPFHVVRAANRCLAKIRRRVQNETLGHRGRKRDPLYRTTSFAPAASPGPAAPTAAYPNPCSPLKRVEPDYGRAACAKIRTK